jgi:uncharacterized protein (TIGR02246 family)
MQASKPSEAITEADLIAREKQVWEAIKKKDWDGFSALLADDQVYVGGQGPQDKKSSVEGLRKAMADATVTDISYSDFKSITLDKDAAIVTYTATAKGTMNGKEMPSTPQRNTSVWANRGGKWMIVFHQDTDVAKDNQPARTGAPSTAKPATGSTEADPVAREKQVWEAIKKKDWDAFGSMLADDQIEVNASGVYDKAGTINGLSQSNLPEMSLSDFKTTKIDDDAAIVTYTVKAAGEQANAQVEHSSTVWVNRGGKWFAVFHQGTEAQSTPAR